MPTKPKGQYAHGFKVSAAEVCKMTLQPERLVDSSNRLDFLGTLFPPQKRQVLTGCISFWEECILVKLASFDIIDMTLGQAQ